MRKEIHCKSFGLTITAGRYQRVKGICSLLNDGTHFLMWDFDDIDYEKVANALMFVRDMYNLPEIHLVATSSGRKYHAYCFKSVVWRLAVQILASTPYIDQQYLGIGIMRGYFTLRITPKLFLNGQTSCFRKVTSFLGYGKADVNPSDCTKEVIYWTRQDRSIA